MKIRDIGSECVKRLHNHSGYVSENARELDENGEVARCMCLCGFARDSKIRNLQFPWFALFLGVCNWGIKTSLQLLYFFFLFNDSGKNDDLENSEIDSSEIMIARRAVREQNTSSDQWMAACPDPSFGNESLVRVTYGAMSAMNFPRAVMMITITIAHHKNYLHRMEITV